MGPNRKPTSDELSLIEYLIDKSLGAVHKPDIQTLLVSEMDDGGMGSLKLYPRGIVEERNFGRQVSDVLFKDEDEVDVLASLYLDEKGELFELDVWKTDFNRLIRIPKFPESDIPFER